MERLLATTRMRLRRAWAASVAHLLEQNPVDQIVQRLGDPHNAIAGLEAAAQAFAAAELGAYHAAGAAVARWTADQVAAPVRKKLVHFDPADPGAGGWDAGNRAALVREITAEQRAVIEGALLEAQRTGQNPRVTAQRIRSEIGLTRAQQEIVDGYRRLLERGQYAEALQRELSSGVSDRAIAAAQRARAALTPAQLETAVDRYRANMIALRAETIARTEGLRIAHEGSEELYRQAIARDDLDPDQIVRTWVHSPRRLDKRHEREFHRSMHGQERGWGEVFVSGLGNELRYPGDPAASPMETIGCACVVTTRIRPSGRALRA